jgi:hypothetical protein
MRFESPRLRTCPITLPPYAANPVIRSYQLVRANSDCTAPLQPDPALMTFAQGIDKSSLGC